MARKIVARIIVALLLGLLTGYAMAKSLANDSANGRDLTMKEYIANFEDHKEELISSRMPMGLALVSGVIMIVLVFGLYELLVLGVDKTLAAVDRRKAPDATSSAPPPW